MRVLVFTSLFPNYYQPNQGIFILQRMVHFERLPGQEVRTVAPIPYCPSWFNLQPWNLFSKIPKKESLEGIQTYHPRYPLVPKVSMRLHALSIFVASVKTVRQIYKAFPFDLIDGHYIYPDGLAAVWLGRVFQKPVVLSARGSDIHRFARFPTIRPMIRRALNRADAVISVCLALKNEMAALGIDPEKIQVIPNGIDSDRFQRKDVAESRLQLGIPKNARVVLSVGHLIPLKGFQILISAMPGILAGYPDVRLYIVGEGPFRKELENEILQMDLTGKVFLVGERPNTELATWYSAADVFCLASSREGWANVIMEALACGTPVIATKVWGTPEIITTDEIGFLVERDVRSIAAGLEKALNRSWDRELIKQHVEGRSWSRVAQEVKEVFERSL
jgi:glycosyltransferase involved in cell wall biosynthesis